MPDAGIQLPVPPLDQHPTPPQRHARRAWLEIPLACGLCLLMLLPFVGRPLHIDDPLNVWIAHQISHHPLDFYGMSTRWDAVDQSAQPFSQFYQNPPLGPFWLAAAASVLGWSEVALHVAMLPFSLATIVAMYLLAARFCRRPLLATLLLLGCPAFVISANTLMCEMPLLCFWTWAVLAWLEASDQPGKRWLLPVAGVLVAAAALSKYPGINLIPLLAAYAVIRPPSPRRIWLAQAACLLIPVAVMIGYDRYTAAMYGHGLLMGAIHFSPHGDRTIPVPTSQRVLDAFAFVGGGAVLAALIAALAAPNWRRRIIVLLLALLAATLARRAVQPPDGWQGNGFWMSGGGFYFAQMGLMAAGGVAILSAAFPPLLHGSVAQRRGNLLLLLWFAGVFVFTTFFNWSINERSILPLLPVACIWAEQAAEQFALGSRTYALAAAAAIVLTLGVTLADDQDAVAFKSAVGHLAEYVSANRIPVAPLPANDAALPPEVDDRNPHRPPVVWFCGHWGFQFYMQQWGAHPLRDVTRPCQAGDLIVVTMSDYQGLPNNLSQRLQMINSWEQGSARWIAVTCPSLGAEFYYSNGLWLPWVIGPVPAEGFIVWRVTQANAPSSATTIEAGAGSR